MPGRTRTLTLAIGLVALVVVAGLLAWSILSVDAPEQPPTRAERDASPDETSPVRQSRSQQDPEAPPRLDLEARPPTTRELLVRELIIESLAVRAPCPALPEAGLHLPFTYERLNAVSAGGTEIIAPAGLQTALATDARGVPRARVTWGPDGEDCAVEPLDEPVLDLMLTDADGAPWSGEVVVCGRRVRSDQGGRIHLDDPVPDELDRGPQQVVSGCGLLAPGVDQLVPLDGTALTVTVQPDLALELEQEDALGGPDDPAPEPPTGARDGLELLLERDDLPPDVLRLVRELGAG